MALDGSTKGWYVRGCSLWRQLGTLQKRGDELRKILDKLRIKSWMEPATTEDGEPWWHRELDSIESRAGELT